MRRWMAAPIVFAAVAALVATTGSPRATAQSKNQPVEETFRTADGVQLHGLFHKSEKNPGSDPVVILLYPPGKDNNMTKGDWEGLANRLTKEGYNVFRFDWRGHGKSTDIRDTDRFWGNPYTGPWNLAFIRGAPRSNVGKVKDDLKFADLGTHALRYMPVYMNDLAAVRAHLDAKNDGGTVNTSSIYLVGAGDAAAVGMAWLAAEWNRPKFAPTPNQLGIAPKYEFVPQMIRGGFEEAGEDISAAVWLTATHPAVIPDRQLQDWVAKWATKLRNNNPMLFLYGAKDNKGKGEANFFFNQVLVANPPRGSALQKLDGTFIRDVPGTALSGAGLLGNNAMLQTEDTILKFLSARQKDRAALISKQRGYSAPYFVDLASFGFVRP